MEKLRNLIYIIEPHPDDALGSASALVYNPDADVIICTLTRTGDERDKINLAKRFRRLSPPLRGKAAITRHWKLGLEDLHWDLRKDDAVPYCEALSSYYDLYGPDRTRQLKDALMSILSEASEKNALVAFPLGLLHPMHVMAGGMMAECVRETGFSPDLLWLYVDHPYDVYCIGATRLKECVNALQAVLGVTIRRYDSVDTDQTAAGEALRRIYHNVHHAEFSDTFRKTFCSFYITEHGRGQLVGLNLKSNCVLYLTDQSLPYYKRGGLGDVAYSFVKAAMNYADQIRIMMPVHGDSHEKTGPGRAVDVREFVYHACQGQTMKGMLRVYEYEGIIFYLIDVPDLWKLEPEIQYAVWADLVISEVLDILDFEPRIFHCNDWQMAFIPFLFKTKYRGILQRKKIKLLFTIHSYGYQGICSKETVLKAVGMDKASCMLCPACIPECPLDKITYLREEQQKLAGVRKPISASFMNAGIYFSDQVSTVSRGYAAELMSYPGMENILVKGIRNGIGSEVYPPSDYPDIKWRYSYEDFEDNKKKNKIWFQEQCGLPVSAEIPMICMVSRLSKVKGIDDIICIIHRLLALPVQLVIIGDDDDCAVYSSVLKRIMSQYPANFYYSAFKPELEFQTYAAADILLMPSLSESCGMTQILAMHYGVVPIVSILSGIQDTVTPFCDETPDQGVGYMVYPDCCWMLLEVIMVALEDFKDKKIWRQRVKKNMITDFHWENGSLREYMKLYHELT